MGRKRRPETIEVTFADFKDAPGIFDAGSELDNSIVAFRKTAERFDTSSPDVDQRIGLKPHHHQLKLLTRDLPPSLPRDECLIYENLFLSMLDDRVRFCRWFLNAHNLPHDRDSIFIFPLESGRWDWQFCNEEETLEKDKRIADPIDFLMPRLSGATYYAMKFLAHFRRAEHIIDSGENTPQKWPSLAREFYLMADVWAEARFMVNELPELVMGQKQVKAGKQGRAMRTCSSFATTHGAEAQEMANSIFANNPNLSWAAIRRTIATRYDVSAETVKNALKNPKKAG